MEAPSVVRRQLPPGRTNIRRFIALFSICVAVALTLTAATWTGKLPVQLALTGPQFKISADRLEGRGFVQFVNAGQGGQATPAIMSGIDTAKITNLCQSTLINTPTGPVTLRVTAGQKAPVTVSKLVLNLAELSGDVSFSDLELGLDASTVDEAPGLKGEQGSYAHQAKRVTVTNLRTTSRITTAGAFRLGGMKMRVLPGRQECF